MKPSNNFYSDELPGPTDTLLIIEVADTSLVYDREIKLPIYASAGIPEYWIVNLEKSEIEAYHSPQDDVYTIREIVRKGGQVKFYGLDRAIEVDKLLG